MMLDTAVFVSFFIGGLVMIGIAMEGS